MTTDDDPVVEEVLERLDKAAELSIGVQEFVLAALLGRVDELLSGEDVPRPIISNRGPREAAHAYLASVRVEGFRGIGEAVTLAVQPGPGLTLVVGRNGSGKSSFAEAAEFAFCGTTQRWAERTKEWSKGWRNLHQQVSTKIDVQLAVDGQREPWGIHVRWTSDDVEGHKTTVSGPGKKSSDLKSAGWERAVAAYRPFLSYNEVGSILEVGPSKRYDAIAPILGLESLVRGRESLGQERLSREKHTKEVEEAARVLRTRLEASGDENARAAAKALGRGNWDLARIERLIGGTETEPGTERAALAGLRNLPGIDPAEAKQIAANLRKATARVLRTRETDAGRAHRLIRLLEQAVEVHEHDGDRDCPICGSERGLSSSRIGELRKEIEHLGKTAAEADDAHRSLRQAQESAKRLIGHLPATLETERMAGVGIDLGPLREAWSRFLEVPPDPNDLATHLEGNVEPLSRELAAVKSASSKRLQELEDEWRPLAIELARLVEPAKRMLRQRDQITELKGAEDWLKKCEADLRDLRFAAIEEKVQETWQTIAVGSNVKLEKVRLAGSGTRRSIEMDVSVDGSASAALGVMSQGELHALALSLFIPRATFSESPFGFVMIDDPVQAMDPVRVDGLARVLDELSRRRQVVVFTHDDRLPVAVRRLQIAARTIEITRRPGSIVEVRNALDPMTLAIDDARALCLTEHLPSRVAQRVVPGLCRQAVEAAASEVIWRKLVKAGVPHGEIERAIGDNQKLMVRLSLALFGEAGRAGEVYRSVSNRWGSRAADTLRECNESGHTGQAPHGDLPDLVRRSEMLARNVAGLE